MVTPTNCLLALPKNSRAHNVLNVDKVRKYIVSPDKFSTRPPPDERSFDLDNAPLYTIDRLIGHRQDQSTKKIELQIKWLLYPIEEATWQSLEEVRTNVPDMVENYIAANEDLKTTMSKAKKPSKPDNNHQKPTEPKKSASHQQPKRLQSAISRQPRGNYSLRQRR